MLQLAVPRFVSPASLPPGVLTRAFQRTGTRVITARLGGITLGLLAGLLSPVPTAIAAPPQLASVTPADGSTGAGSTTPLVFTFDQPMDTTVPYFPTSPGVPLIGNFEFLPASFALQVSGTWSADGRTLTVRPNLSLPLNQTFNWKLNPAGTLFPNKSKTGELLATVAGSYTTGAAAPAPLLTSATPATGAIDVPVASTVVFTFNQVMKTNTAIAGSPPAIPGAVSWSGSEVNAAKFSYRWTADSKSLICTYAGDLPVGTTVSWILNPVTAPVKLEGINGRPVASGANTGNFTTAGGVPACDPDGLPDTWGQYSVFKSTSFRQVPGAEPVPSTEEPPTSFSAVIQSPRFGPFVTAGSLTLPAGSVSNLTVIGGLGQLITAPASEAALNAAFPAGNYTLRFTQTGQPERVINLPLPASAPPIPKIVNLAAAQAIPAGSDFTLQWNAFTGAQAEDFLFLSIGDGQGNTFFEAPDACFPRPLGVGATSIVIPAGTLVSNTTYTARLTFSDAFHRVTNTLPEMAGFAGVSRTTVFTVKTAGPNQPPPAAAAIQAARVLANGQFQFEISGSASRLYSVQRTPTLTSPTWGEVGSLTLDAAGRGTFSNLPVTPGSTYFYRVVGQ
jgi:hypothetical protein